MKHPNDKWEFPKIGRPDIVPEIVGSLLQGPQSKIPLNFGNSQMCQNLEEQSRGH